MKTNGGILELGKREREALQIIKEHIKRDISYCEGGTFCTEKEKFDSVAARKAEIGLKVLDFVLHITE